MRAPVSSVFLVFLLWFAGLGAAAQFAKIAVPFALVRATYPDAGAEIGWLVSLISLVGAVLGIVAGDLVGRFGPKRILLFGLALGAAISFWQAGSLSFTTMLASRFLEGISHLAIVVAAPTLIARLSEQRYVGAAMALWSTFFGVAFAVVAWVVMPLIGSGGLATVFIGHGAFMLTITILVALVVPGPQDTFAAAEKRAQNVLRAHRRVYTSPHILAPGAGWILYTLTFVSLIALLPERLPASQAELAVGVMPLVSIAVSMLVVPLLLRHRSSIAVVMMGFALATLLVVAQLIVDLQALFAISLFAVLGLVQGASFAAVPELNTRTEDQALAYGFMAQGGNIGNLLGTPLLIAIGGAGGDTAMFLAVAVIYLIGIGLHGVLARQCRLTPN